MLLNLLLNSPKNNKVMDHTVFLVRINNLSKKAFHFMVYTTMKQ